jgi:hypothetical protein
MVFCPFTVSSSKVRTLQSDVGSCNRHVAYGHPELAWVIPVGSTSLNVAWRGPATPPSKSPVEDRMHRAYHQSGFYGQPRPTRPALRSVIPQLARHCVCEL